MASSVDIAVYYFMLALAAALSLFTALRRGGWPRARPRAERRKSRRAAGAVKSLPAKSKRFALVIGVDKYADTQITTLGGGSNDAAALAEALVEYAGFPADQVVLLASDQPAERQPTRGNILRRLSNLAAAVPKDGLLLFAFAGHGIEVDGRAFLLPSDAQVSDDVMLLEQTAVNVTQIREWVRQTGVRQVLMLLDACRNDPRGRSDTDNPLTTNYTRAFSFDTRNREVEAFVTIYATAIGRRAYEYKEKKQGYFTWALVEGLKGGAANERGEVTLDNLIKYLQERVPKQVALDIGRGLMQRPFADVAGYKADELVLAVANPNAARELSLSKDVEAGPAAEPAGGPTPQASPAEVKGRTSPAIINLEGTVWSGLGTSGEFVVEFLRAGQLRYLVDGIRNGKKHQFATTGSWKQAGDFVQFSVGDYSVVTCRIEGGVIKCEGKNNEGEKLSMALTPKEK